MVNEHCQFDLRDLDRPPVVFVWPRVGWRFVVVNEHCQFDLRDLDRPPVVFVCNNDS